LLAGDVFVVGKEVTLSGLAGVVDEDVCIGGHTCYGADHVAEACQLNYTEPIEGNLLVQDVELLC